MLRRLFFLFPDVDKANQAAAELRQAGVDSRRVHAAAKRAGAPSPLPLSVPLRERDARWWMERVLWYGNITLFVAAFAAMAVTMIWGLWLESLVALAFVYLSGIAGTRFRFASTMPNVHLDDFRGELDHGEVLLMVDVAPGDAAGVEQLLQGKHPEATEADPAWTLTPRSV